MSNQHISIAGAPIHLFNWRADTLHAYAQQLKNNNLPHQRQALEVAIKAVTTANSTHRANLEKRKRLSNNADNLKKALKKACKEVDDFKQTVHDPALKITRKEEAVQCATATVNKSEHKLANNLPVKQRVMNLASTLEDRSIDYGG